MLSKGFVLAALLGWKEARDHEGLVCMYVCSVLVHCWSVWDFFPLLPH